jgi:Type II/IV secretion system protein
LDERASDIHMEPSTDGLTVRFRVDGRLRAREAPPSTLRDAVISRIKLMAALDIAERRLPQDGRISHAVRGGTPAERLFSRSAGSDWRLKVPFQLSPITKFQCLLSAFLFPDRIPYFVDEENLLA